MGSRFGLFRQQEAAPGGGEPLAGAGLHVCKCPRALREVECTLGRYRVHGLHERGRGHREATWEDIVGHRARVKQDRTGG